MTPKFATGAYVQGWPGESRSPVTPKLGVPDIRPPSAAALGPARLRLATQPAREAPLGGVLRPTRAPARRSAAQATAGHARHADTPDTPDLGGDTSSGTRLVAQPKGDELLEQLFVFHAGMFGRVGEVLVAGDLWVGIGFQR